MADLTKIQGFDLLQETYKYVGDHAIRADILVPQTNYTGKRPAVVRFHGGGLVCDPMHFSCLRHDHSFMILITAI
jgi:cephalosporin-C deacetylase-like acetyl esterase